MRLHPAVTQDEAYDWLKIQIVKAVPPAQESDLETTLRQFAEAMAAVSALELPDDVEPLLP